MNAVVLRVAQERRAKRVLNLSLALRTGLKPAGSGRKAEFLFPYTGYGFDYRRAEPFLFSTHGFDGVPRGTDHIFQPWVPSPAPCWLQRLGDRVPPGLARHSEGDGGTGHRFQTYKVS